MRIITILSLLLLTSPAFAQLTKEDLRTILKEEITASEKRTREYIDLKIETVNARIDATNAKIEALDKSLNARIDETNARIDGVEKSLNAKIGALDKRMSDMWRLMMGLFGLVAATIAIPQIIIAFRNKDQKELEKRQEDLQTEIQQLRGTD